MGAALGSRAATPRAGSGSSTRTASHPAADRVARGAGRFCDLGIAEPAHLSHHEGLALGVLQPVERVLERQAVFLGRSGRHGCVEFDDQLRGGPATRTPMVEPDVSSDSKNPRPLELPFLVGVEPAEHSDENLLSQVLGIRCRHLHSPQEPEHRDVVALEELQCRGHSPSY
jgi:hypothetical protein